VFATDSVEIRLPLTDGELATLGLPVAFQASDDTPGPQVDLSASVGGQMRHWAGEVVRTDSAIDSQTRTMSAIVEVADPYGAAAEAAGAPLAIGLFVSADITGRQIDYAYALPRSALRGADMVYVANLDGTLSIRNVTVADSTVDRVIVTAGVQEGERIVTSPLRAAAEGMLIRALDQNGTPLDPDPEDEDSDEDNAASEETVLTSRAP
jgi:multidrug efflux pump subunit AcrA (membrane-fusion protein)